MNKFFVALIILFLVSACQSAKDAFTLKKKSSADEFLVEKKSPLVLPPSYGKLPLPGSVQETEVKSESNEEKDIKDLLGMSEDSSSNNQNKSKNKSIEKSILEKIK